MTKKTKKRTALTKALVVVSLVALSLAGLLFMGSTSTVTRARAEEDVAPAVADSPALMGTSLEFLYAGPKNDFREERDNTATQSSILNVSIKADFKNTTNAQVLISSTGNEPKLWQQTSTNINYKNYADTIWWKDKDGTYGNYDVTTAKAYYKPYVIITKNADFLTSKDTSKVFGGVNSSYYSTNSNILYGFLLDSYTPGGATGNKYIDYATLSAKGLGINERFYVSFCMVRDSLMSTNKDNVNYTLHMAEIIEYSKPVETSFEDLFVDYLEEFSNVDATADELSYVENIRSAMGWQASDSDATINVNFLQMTSLTAYEERTLQFTVKAMNLLNEDYVIGQLANGVVKEVDKDGNVIKTYSKLTDFNATWAEYVTYIKDGQVYTNETYERTVRQAKDFDYTYNGADNIGTIDIVYSEYLYKDVFFSVGCNIEGNYLTLYLYTTDVDETDDGYYVINFNYEKIEEMALVSAGWLFNLEQERTILIEHCIDSIQEGIEEDSSLLYTKKVNAGEDGAEFTGTQIFVKKDRQDLLFGLNIAVIASVVPDEEYTVRYRYSYLDENLSEKKITSEPFTLWFSNCKLLNGINFETQYGDVINGAISPLALDGQTYYKYNNITKTYDTASKTLFIDVMYTYNSLIKITDNLGGVKYQSTEDFMTAEFEVSVLDIVIPEGYRIKSVTSPERKDENGLSIIEFDYNDRNPMTTLINLRKGLYSARIYKIDVEFTDYWNLRVRYLEQYKDSAFLEAKEFSKEVKVKDFADIYALKDVDLLKIMGKESFDVLNLATVDNDRIEVKFNHVDTYYVDLAEAYTYASMKQMSADGETITEVKVYVTPYSAWAGLFGQEWSILWLNSEDDIIFNYSNDISADDLYGFFTIATFEQKQTDLNSILSAYKTGGCKTVYQSRKVVGSDLYKWADANKTNVVGGPIASICLWGCEFADINSENKEVYTYFLFLDGTSTLNYTALNGADSYDDEDSSINNKVEDIEDDLSDWWNGDSTFSKVVKIVLWIIAGLACAFVLVLIIKGVIWCIKWLKE